MTADPSARRAAAVAVLRAVLTATAVVVVYFAIPVSGSTSLRAGVLLALGLVGFSLLLTWQVRSITRADRPRLRAVEALATVVPLLLVLFAMSYFVLEREDRRAFSQQLSRLDALYFTVTVFSTVGFGDIVPVTGTARAMVTLQMIANLVVLGLGLRLLGGAVKLGLTRQHGDDSLSD